jgi:ferric-dicitrate binding protein FerR (iron transport regulator)
MTRGSVNRDGVTACPERRINSVKTAALALCGLAVLWAQDGMPQPSEQYLKGQQYSAEEDSRVLKLYDGLRVADIIDFGATS